MVSGMARFRGQPVMVIGTEKGNTTEERIKRNFGMARPEGYRKATRLMDLAGRFGLPVLSFVDTAGAYPGRGAEERGQAEAIASAIRGCLKLPTPMVAAVIGEGGSGGAIALATGNRVLMFDAHLPHQAQPVAKNCLELRMCVVFKLWTEGANRDRLDFYKDTVS